MPDVYDLFLAHTTCLRVYIVTQKDNFNKFTIPTVQEIGSHFWIDEYV